MNSITVVYQMPIHIQQGGLYCNGGFGRYIDELAKHFAEVVVCAPVPQSVVERPEYRLHARNIRLCRLPPFDTFVQLLRCYPRILYTIARDVRRWDLINLRIPSYYAFFTYLLARLYRRRVFLLVVGDTRKVYSTFGFRGVKGWLARLWVETLEATDAAMVRRSLTFVNGDGLLLKYQNVGAQVHRTTTSSVCEADILDARIRPVWTDRIRLLYVGRLYLEKGIGILLEALRVLRDESLELSLTIVGDGKYQADLEAQVRKLALEPYVEFRGHVPFGELLFQVYRDSDIFVLPSLSEGMPRVLGEAMSQGLPVVTTRVGGIPGFLQDGVTACLVTPGSLTDLAAGVRRLVNDPPLAQRLIANGLGWAREHTVERHVREMLEIVGGILPGSGSLSPGLTGFAAGSVPGSPGTAVQPGCGGVVRADSKGRGGSAEGCSPSR